MAGPWDVIVVGARVAGAATGMLLARAGLRVLILDRARRGSDTLSTHALMRGATLQLQRWGLLDAVIAAGTPAVRRTVFHYGDDVVPITLRPASGISALYAPRRTLLDRLLADEAVRAGATVEFGATVTELIWEDGRVAGLVCRDRSGMTRCQRAGLVVGADGRGSAVAEAVGAGTLLSGTAAGSIRYGYWRGVDVDGYEWFYEPGRTAGLIPTNDGLTCVFLGWPDAGPSASDVPVAPPSLARRLGCAQLVGRERTVPGRPGFLRQAWGPGWALVGDAGYWKDPLSTHGMTDALRDAELLARAILAASKPGADQGRALAGYQSVRDRLSLPMVEVVEHIASYAWDLAEVPGLLRALSSAMTDEVEELASFELVA